MPRYTLGRRIEQPKGFGSRWIVIEAGVHQQYYPIITINTAGLPALEEKLARLAIDAWNIDDEKSKNK